MLIVAIIVLALGLTIYASKKRKNMLAKMTPEEREVFLAEEKTQQEAQKLAADKKQEISDGKASLPARQAINVAKAEGRRYARTWIPSRNVEKLERWARRQGYTALRVKTGNSGDVQMTFSGWK